MNWFSGTGNQESTEMSYLFTPETYEVTISASSLIGAPPADGFMDHVTLEEYVTNGTQPASLANSESKARANVRYWYMIFYLTENQSPFRVYDRDNGGATVDAPGSYFKFRITYERPGYVYTYNEFVNDPAHPTYGQKILTSANAIKRQVARVFTQTISANEAWVKDPVLDGHEWLDKEITVGTPLSGTPASAMIVAESLISVTRIS